MNKELELKIQALTENNNALNNSIVDLRVALTLSNQELTEAQQKISELEAQLEDSHTDKQEDVQEA